MKSYDLLVIGGGSAGLAAVLRAEELKAKTLFINSGLPLGGTCLNVGCIPSKRLLYIAQLIAQTQSHAFAGFNIEIKKCDFHAIISDTNKLIAQLRRNNQKIVKELTQITYLEGLAQFVDSKTVVVDNKKYRAEHIVIANGSTAQPPPIVGINETGFITHMQALRLKQIPKKLTIIGAGAIGIEFAQLFARFGSAVTVLDHSATILANTDATLANHLARLLGDENITMYTDVQIVQAQKERNKKKIIFKKNNRLQQVISDELLIATGKTPNTASLALDKTGVAINKKQAIIINKYLQTNQAHIYAAGDVIDAPVRIETTASREGIVAVNNALSNAQESIDYNQVPFSLFTDPEFAYVGMQERDITDKNQYVILVDTLDDLPKAHIINRTEGMIKLIVHKKSRQLKGAHLLCAGAADIIEQAALLISNNYTVDDIIKLTPVYPTFSEAIKRTIQQNWEE